jgi:hypothetical protein
MRIAPPMRNRDGTAARYLQPPVIPKTSLL